MHVEVKNIGQAVEVRAMPSTELHLSKNDSGKYVLRVVGPGRVSVVTVTGLNELQIRMLASEVCLKV